MTRSHSTAAPEGAPARALVLDRWNSWVRVWFPDTGETEWVDLGETGYAPVESSSTKD